MFRRNYLFQSLFIMLSVILLVACQQENEPVSQQPVIVVASARVDVAAQGGAYSFTYAVEHPKDGAVVGIEFADEGWISVEQGTQEGRVDFVVAVNRKGVPREATFTLTYPEADPVVVTVHQAAAEISNTSFEIRVTDKTEISYVFDIYPKDKEQLYVYYTTSLQFMEKHQLVSDQDVLDYMMELFLSDADYFGTTVEDVVMSYYALSGDQVGIEVKGVVPGKDFVIFVYGFEFEQGQMRVVTELAQCVDTAVEAPREEIPMEISVKVDAATVDVTIDPGNYTGRYFYLQEAVSSFFTDPDVTQQEIAVLAEQLWYEYLTVYLQFGFTVNVVMDQLTVAGDFQDHLNLLADTDYFVAVVPVAEAGYACGYPIAECFATESVVPSDNQLTIRVSDIRARSVTISVETANQDPYVFGVFSQAFFEGKTDQQVIAYFMENYYDYLVPIYGDFVYEMTGLEPNTPYFVAAFGFDGGVANTGLFRENFETAEEVFADIQISLNVVGAFDTKEVAALDANYADLQAYDVLFVVEYETTPQASAMYYGIYRASSLAGVSEQGMKDALLGNGKKENFSVVSLLTYDVEYIAIAMAEDAAGALSPLFVSDPFTLRYEERNDPQEFLNYRPSKAPVVSYSLP